MHFFCSKAKYIKQESLTDYHASADVTELWFLAVVVFELVRFVVDWLNGFWRRGLLSLLLLYLLIIDEIHLDTDGGMRKDGK